MGNMGRPMDPISMGPLMDIFAVKLVSWSETMLCWILWQWIRHSGNGSFGRSITCKEGKSVFTGACSSENKMPFLWWLAVQCYKPIPDSSMMTPSHGVIMGAHCWSVLLADWAVSPDWPWWVKVHILEPMHNFRTCHHSHFVCESPGEWQKWLGKEAN